jgi:alanine racemase
VDLDAVEYNYESMYKNLQKDVKMFSVIKADGYGHGALPIAKILEDKEYIFGFATATVDESLDLREGGIKKPLLVLGCAFPDSWEAAINNDIRMTVYTKGAALGIAELARKLKKTAIIHIKIDTGMSRLGFLVDEESADIIAEISKMEGLSIEGMFTHFAKADETDKTFTEKQYKEYIRMKDMLSEKGVVFKYYHTCNSAGIIDCKEANLNLVRAGISTYGIYPSQEVIKENVPLKPAMTLISHVAHVKWIEEETPISYGGTFITKKRTKVATIPVGYGDGYPRSLSNKGYVLIRGKKAPILGRVCMDQFMVDVTGIDDVEFNDKVTLIGNDGDECLPVEISADLSERFPYEFVCDLGKRIPRVYHYKGKVKEDF